MEEERGRRRPWEVKERARKIVAGETANDHSFGFHPNPFLSNAVTIEIWSPKVHFHSKPNPSSTP